MHPKWHEASYSADIPGWQRFKAAEDWLVQHNVMTSSQLSEKTEFDRSMVKNRVSNRTIQANGTSFFANFWTGEKAKERRVLSDLVDAVQRGASAYCVV